MASSIGGDEDLAVADAAGARRLLDGLDGPLDQAVLDHQLDLHLGQEVDDVLGAAVELGVALLPAEALGLEHGDALRPTSCSASFTSSSLNGLMIASIFFIRYCLFALLIRPVPGSVGIPDVSLVMLAVSGVRAPVEAYPVPSVRHRGNRAAARFAGMIAALFACRTSNRVARV